MGGSPAASFEQLVDQMGGLLLVECFYARAEKRLRERFELVLGHAVFFDQPQDETPLPVGARPIAEGAALAVEAVAVIVRWSVAVAIGGLAFRRGVGPKAVAVRRDESGLLDLGIDRLLQSGVEPGALVRDLVEIVQFGFDGNAELM